MSHDSKLVYMANQIGRFFAAQGQDKAVAAVATHLKRFWDPRMRRGIIAQVRAGEAFGLDPIPLAAVRQLGEESAALPQDSDRAAIREGFTPSETDAA